jgi:micrococcal nuclease
MYTYWAQIIRVIDGDSVIAQLDLGCHVFIEKSLRLYGINAPELRGETKLAGLEARDYLSELINQKKVCIKTLKDSGDKYGRLLAKIYTGLPGSGDEECVNDLMLASGHAQPYDGK